MKIPERRNSDLNWEVWYGFFVKWHINLCGLFNTKAVFVEE